MNFDPTAYGPQVADILALDGAGERLMAVAGGRCSSPEALMKLETSSPGLLFPNSRASDAALSGLYLYFSCIDRAHEIAQNIDTVDGSYWHGIVHRQEPDASNSRYWFRKVGQHPIFPELARTAAPIAARFSAVAFSSGVRWDPSEFIDVCENARQSPGTPLEKMALEIQRAEWQLLFDYCAAVGSVAV